MGQVTNLPLFSGSGIVTSCNPLQEPQRPPLPFLPKDLNKTVQGFCLGVAPDQQLLRGNGWGLWPGLLLSFFFFTKSLGKSHNNIPPVAFITFGHHLHPSLGCTPVNRRQSRSFRECKMFFFSPPVLDAWMHCFCHA